MSDENDIQEVPEELYSIPESHCDYLNALAAAYSMADAALCNTAADTARKERIKRKCLRIVDQLVGEIYDGFFDKDEKDDDD